jgi:G3E family GTPase
MIPRVLVLTGFLGAGKTTLLNRMIAARALGDPAGTLGAGGRLALIVNELGEIGIDGALLPSEMTRQVELPGLDRTVLDLLDGAPDIATIVIETTGVAEPLPIAWALGREPLASRVRLTAVVTLVDPLCFPSQRSLSPAVESQVAYADVVVLTKTDVATPEQVAATRTLVAQLAPRAPVLTGGPEEIVGWLAGALADPELPRRRDGLVIAPLRSHGIDSVWVPADGLVDLEELGDALAELPPDYVRVKGIVWAVDGREGPTEPHWAAVHRVGLRVSSERLDRPGPRCLVALGPGVQREPLAACVQRAMLSSESETAP